MSAPITLDGRLGQDPELKTTSNGKTLTRLSVVTNGRKRTESGTWEDVDTTWWDVTLFGLAADDAATQLHKGDRVVIVGRVRDEHWETPAGEKRSRKAVIADTFGRRAKGGQSSQWTESAKGFGESEPAVDPWATQAPF